VDSGEGDTDGAQCSVCDGKVTEMTLRYDGDETAHVVVKQKAKKKKKKKKKWVVVFDGWVDPGETFTFTGQDKKGTLGNKIKVFVDDDLDTKIHTSCSQPIGPGMSFGDFTVVEAYSRNGGLICPL